MVPASFEQSTHFLGRPPDMTDEQCDPLSVANVVTTDGTPFVVSCWKITAEELAEIQRTGRVWLMVCGQTMPPVIVSGVSPF